MCETCKAEKVVKDNWTSKVQRFCSRSCKRFTFSDDAKKNMSEVRMGSKNHFYGKKHTEKTRKHWSKIRKGKFYPQAIEAAAKANRGRVRSLETKLKLSSAHTGRPKIWMQGDNHPKWIKDRTKLKTSGDSNKDRRSAAYGYWRQQVWIRDSFKCKIANSGCDGRLEAHHILSYTDYPELRYKINNGITLCQAHHPRKRAEEKLMIPVFQGLLGLSTSNYFE